MVVVSHSSDSLWKKLPRFCSKIEASSSVQLLTSTASAITWSKPSFLLDAALQHCWALALPEPNGSGIARTQHLDMSRCWDVAKFCPLVAKLLPTCCRIVGISSFSVCHSQHVGNMLATMFAKWSLGVNVLKILLCTIY